MIEYKPQSISQIQKSEAIKLVKAASHDTTLIIDFDETLFLRNSTAEYLNSLKPRTLGVLLLKFLYFVRPWSWLPVPFRGSQVRDWFLVVVPTIVFPWTWFLWQKKAKQLAEQHKNQELFNAIAQNDGSPIIVATLGFNFIVEPILNSWQLNCDRLIGCRFWRGGQDRSEGKLMMLNKFLPSETIKSATAITDSADDLPLLREVAQPCLVTWPLAKYVAPLNNIYLPFFYVEKVKRVGEKYLPKVILWDDLPLLWLAFSWQASQPLLHGIGILFLMFSFWCVYEIGYYENDLVAEKYEDQPKLSVTYHKHKEMMKAKHPWIWAWFLGILGTACLTKAQGVNLPFNYELLSPGLESLNPFLLPLAGWIVFLLATRSCFWVYNYLNKPARTWLYILLQSFRYYGFAAVTATNLIGTSLLSSQILVRTLLYIFYRYGGGSASSWPKLIPQKLLRWVVFVFILSAIAIGTRDLSLWQNWQTWAIMAWCLIQGHKQVLRVVSQFAPIINLHNLNNINNSFASSQDPEIKAYK